MAEQSVEGHETRVSDRVSQVSPQSALDEARTIGLMLFPDMDLETVERVFGDVAKLFAGQWPGYKACNTEYHDLKHTTDALLSISRLIHGAILQGEPLRQRHIVLGMVCALLHDSGYIQTVGDRTGTGAKYTLVHVPRSVGFAKEYLPKLGFSREDLVDCRDILNCTGLNARVSEIRFRSRESELLGKMLGSADLLGQMADRTYLEKLLFLFYEFSEGHVAGYDTELDLLRKTVAFYDSTEGRLAGELGGAGRYMIGHFRERWGMDRDPYQDGIQKNRAYLLHIVKNHEQEYRRLLRRGNIVGRLQEKGL